MMSSQTAARPGLPRAPGESANKLFWAGFIVVVVLGVGLRAWLYSTTGFTVGGAYVTFRFAEQFAAGNGLVFNVGEWVGGNTSLLHSFLLGLGACTGAAIPMVARIQGILYDIGAVCFLLNLVRGKNGLLSPVLQLTTIAMLFLCPMLFWYSINGLETSLYLGLIYFIMDRTLKGLDAVWYLSVALLFFCRPDGVLAVGVALAFVTVQHRKIPWRAMTVVFLIGIIYLGFNYLVYHSFIPLTVKAKGLVYHDGLARNIDYIAGRFFFHRIWLLAAYVGTLLALLVWRGNNPKLLLLGLAAMAYLLFVLFAPTLRTWYVAPFLALSALSLLLAMFGLLEEFRPRASGPVAAVVLIGYLGACFIADRTLQRECYSWHQRSLQLTEAEGTWYKNNTPPDAKILVECLETGYFSKRHTSDWPGLASPSVLQLVKQNPKIGFFELAERLQMDYVTIHNSWNMVDQTNIPPNFQKVATFESNLSGPVMGSNESVDFIYQRVHDLDHIH